MHPLANKIDSLQRRLVIRQRLIAACWIVALVLAAALALGLADYLFRFADRGLRIMATAMLIATAAWAVYRWWYLPGRRRLVPLTVAKQIEHRFPQLSDALASAVEFLAQGEDDPAAGSAQLRRHVITDVQNAVDRLPLDDVIDRRPLRRAATWLAAALVALALCVAIDARAVTTALARLAVPLGGIEWPRTNHLEFPNPPIRIAAGQTFEAELIDTVGHLPEDVTIEYRTANDGRRQFESEPMTRVGEVMLARRQNVEQSFSFRAVGGDDHTMGWHEVTVVEPPQLKSMEIVVHPPTYSGLPSASGERHLEVLAGSSVEVRGTSNRPLSAARIVLENDNVIPGEVSTDTPQTSGSFHIPRGKWLAEQSGAYRVELTDGDGLTADAGRWNLRVNPDSSPTVEWRSPSDDLFVTAAATVPIELAVTDNLAIQTIDLIVKRSSASDDGSKNPSDDATQTTQPSDERLELFRGPARAAVHENATTTANADTRHVEHVLDLAALNPPLGSRWMLEGEAADYRPGIGRTIAPRRITIISADELEARLADRRTQIVRQLEQALAIQRTARADTRRLEIQQRDAGDFAAGDRNALQTADLNQRRVTRTLVDRVEGVPALVGALLAELEMNRLDVADTVASMRSLTDTLESLAARPLPIAEEELTSARNAADATGGAANATALASSLSAAGAAQEEVVNQVERLLGELAGWADFQRFTRQLAELRQDQLAHEKTSRSEIGLATLPLDVRELSRPQRANLNKASAGQDALARRYEKIEQGIDDLSRQMANKDAKAAATLGDAVNLARRLAIGMSMHESSRELGENRVGVALDRQAQIAADIEQVLEVLRNQAGERGDKLIERLRQAQQRLAQLREQAARLRAETEQMESQGAAAGSPQSQALQKKQQELSRQAEELARELDRLQAEAAGRSTRSAADRLNNQEPGNNQNTANRPSSSRDVRAAEKDLEEAERQLAERLQEAEFDLALEFVRRFQAELHEMIARQITVIQETSQLDGARQPATPLSPEQSRKLGELSAAERQLAGLAIEHSEVLTGLTAVRISLEEAAHRLRAAAEVLDTGETGAPAQDAERRALVRLEGMLEAFAQTAAEAGQKPPGGANAGNQNGQQRRPTFELLEVKMLRMLQVDLNERTRAFRERIGGPNPPADAAGQEALNREAQELAAEQRRLAGLVQEMLTRNNK